MWIREVKNRNEKSRRDEIEVLGKNGKTVFAHAILVISSIK